MPCSPDDGLLPTSLSPWGNYLLGMQASILLWPKLGEEGAPGPRLAGPVCTEAGGVRAAKAGLAALASLQWEASAAPGAKFSLKT